MLELFAQTIARIEEWKAQPDVLGIVLVGSKGHGHADSLSDDDLEIVLSDEAHARLSPAECGEILVNEAKKKLIYDVQYISLSYLQQKHLSPHDLDHWPYQRGQVLYARNGLVTNAVEKAGQMTPEFRRLRLLHATIDTWIVPRRAEKTIKRGYEASNRLIISRGAKALARLIFGLEWRWVPLDHWLEAELTTLEDSSQVAPLLVKALEKGKPAPLAEALDRLEERLFAEGIPRPAERRELFFELIHPSRATERSIHGLY
ncbi:MAG: DUF4037 domain-containing protein [Chloroflexi bacterium]|uniref:DUF4037 domain-containing protein n=1 Tax=Candidatus Chlorohelix allophototropha TaxID=3003348 RepID=A0A8T7M7I8_9CHLR|nr:DUF4037 domain-containing protein [Chloroflexota bacterium]WJW68039.1 hypothetical protein OZ401_003634 [Chloroflexota bacterium L227-S17]